MSKRYFIIAVFFAFIAVTFGATPIKNLLLQSDLDAGGYAVTNAITGTNATGLVTRGFAFTNFVATNDSRLTNARPLSGTLAISQGGTGATNAATAFSALKQDATTTATGVGEVATDAEVIAGSDSLRWVVPSALAAWWSSTWTAIKAASFSLSGVWTWTNSQIFNGSDNRATNQDSDHEDNLMTRKLSDARHMVTFNRGINVTTTGWKILYKSLYGAPFNGLIQIKQGDRYCGTFIVTGGINYGAYNGAIIQQVYCADYPSVQLAGVRAGSENNNNVIEVNFADTGSYQITMTQFQAIYDYATTDSWIPSTETDGTMITTWAAIAPRPYTFATSGDIETGRVFRFPSTASAPANTTTPVSWMEIQQGTNSFRLPLFQ